MARVLSWAALTHFSHHCNSMGWAGRPGVEVSDTSLITAAGGGGQGVELEPEGEPFTQYDDFHTIDWQRDLARDRMRHRCGTCRRRSSPPV